MNIETNQRINAITGIVGIFAFGIFLTWFFQQSYLSDLPTARY